MVASNESIFRGLAEIRRRRRIAWTLFFGFLPAVATFGLVTRSDRWTAGFALAWLGLFLFAALRAAFARCPRCGGLFHIDRSVLWSNAFTDRCLQCDLPL